MRKLGQPKESEIQKAILDYLRLRGIFCWKNNSVGIYKKATGSYISVGMKGVADILGVLGDGSGRLIAVEVKRPGNYPTPEQKLFLEQITAKKGIAFVAYGIEDCEKELNH